MKRHATDAISLGFGTTFLALTAAWLLTRWIAVDLPSPGWLVAVGLVVVGAVGLVTGVVRGRGDRPKPQV
jgi:hypothetical protein